MKNPNSFFIKLQPPIASALRAYAKERGWRLDQTFTKALEEYLKKRNKL